MYACMYGRLNLSLALRVWRKFKCTGSVMSSFFCERSRLGGERQEKSYSWFWVGLVHIFTSIDITLSTEPGTARDRGAASEVCKHKTLVLCLDLVYCNSLSSLLLPVSLFCFCLVVVHTYISERECGSFLFFLFFLASRDGGPHNKRSWNG